MAIIIPPPPPPGASQSDRVWTDWYVKLQQILSSTAGISWALVDKAGSNLSDLANRTHAMLTGIAGTGVNHISNAEATTVTNVNTNGHQGLTSINGTGNFHISAAEGTVLTNINASGHQGLTAINGTGNRHISVAEATDVTNLNTTGRLSMQSSTVDPTTANVAASQWIIWKNTTANEVRLWVNDGGTMKKSAALT